MKPLLDASFFKASTPYSDKHIHKYWVQPAILPALLNAESSVVAAPPGYGKSTLALLAQQQRQDEWLNINLQPVVSLEDDFMNILLRQVTLALWQHIEENPERLAQLGSRTRVMRYFLNLYSEVDIDYLLTRLAEDHPAHQASVAAFREITTSELFASNATAEQRLSILCDCVQKLNLQGVAIWLDLGSEWQQLSQPLATLLEDFFDSLHLMRRSKLYIKCLALPSVCRRLQQLRGMETLSATLLDLTWSQTELQLLVERRLAVASSQTIQSLGQLIDPKQFVGLLQETSNANNPIEWLALMYIMAERLNRSQQIPIDEEAWHSIQRTYYADRIKIRMDEQGSFWRGNRLLAELTPKKRAIYPMVRYLYEHPGVHRTYSLLNALAVDEQNLNTMISRARKDHLEPFASSDNDDSWIYLVTDLRGGGYELRHTDRTS